MIFDTRDPVLVARFLIRRLLDDTTGVVRAEAEAYLAKPVPRPCVVFKAIACPNGCVGSIEGLVGFGAALESRYRCLKCDKRWVE